MKKILFVIALAVLTFTATAGDPVKMDNTTQKNAKGEMVSLYDVKASYILVDFWAGWCGPCRRESPFVKAAAEKYKDVFTVFAMSLDRNAEDWQKAITEDGTEIFIHTYLGGKDMTPETKAMLAKLDVKTIPSNFLLDKDFNIIATNLRGEALAAKLAELTGK